MTLRLIRSKKGFEIAFNWIFVLFAGFIILMFFFTFMRNHYSDTKTSESVKSQTDAEFLLRASQGSRSSEKIIFFPSKLSFSCDDGVSQYMIGGSNFFSSYNSLVVFSPVSLQKTDLLIKTESFDAPFSIIPTTSITNKRIQYVLLGDVNDPSLKKIYSFLPKNTSKKFYSEDISTFTSQGYDSIIFVTNKSDFISSSKVLTSLDESNYENVFLVSYEYLSVYGGAGKLNFYRYDGSNFNSVKESFFIDDIQLFGAVISGDASLYSCQLNKMLDKLNLLSALHEERIQEFERVVVVNSCKQNYDAIIMSLSTIQGIVSDDDFTDDNIKILFESIQQINFYNTKLIRETSCPPVY